MELGLDCRLALSLVPDEQILGTHAQVRWCTNDPIDTCVFKARETLDRYQKMLHVFFARWTLQPDVGFTTLGCFPIEPISVVRACRMPALGGASVDCRNGVASNDRNV